MEGGFQGMHEIELKSFPFSGSSDRNFKSTSLKKLKTQHVCGDVSKTCTKRGKKFK